MTVKIRISWSFSVMSPFSHSIPRYLSVSGWGPYISSKCCQSSSIL